jgi:hypothetical protein
MDNWLAHRSCTSGSRKRTHSTTGCEKLWLACTAGGTICSDSKRRGAGCAAPWSNLDRAKTRIECLPPALAHVFAEVRASLVNGRVS